MSGTDRSPAAPWMRRWLVAAGIYNLVWGIPVILLDRKSVV